MRKSISVHLGIGLLFCCLAPTLLLSGCATIEPTDFKMLISELAPAGAPPAAAEAVSLEVNFLDESKGKIGSLYESGLGIKTTDLYLYHPENLKLKERIAGYLNGLGFTVEPASQETTAGKLISVSILRANVLMRAMAIRGTVSVEVAVQQPDQAPESAKSTVTGTYTIPVIAADFRPQRWIDEHEDTLNDMYAYLVLAAFEKAWGRLHLNGQKGGGS